MAETSSLRIMELQLAGSRCEQIMLLRLNRLLNLPWRLSKEQISWLKNRMKDKRREVRALAKEQYEMRFPPKRLEDIEDNFDFLDEDDLIE